MASPRLAFPRPLPTLSVVKRDVGVVILLSYFLLGLNGAIFLALHLISEIDLVLILSPFGANAFVAQNFFESLSFDGAGESSYSFSQGALDYFLTELRRDIDYSIDRRASVVMRKGDFEVFSKSIIESLRSFAEGENLKYYPQTVLGAVKDYLTTVSVVYPEGVLTRKNIDYFVEKFTLWISEQKLYDSERRLTRTSYWLILLSVSLTPIIPTAILWGRAFGAFDMTQELLGTVSAIATGAAIGFWGTTVNRMGENRH